VPGASWATTAWLITHADRYGIDSVRFSAKEWTRAKGWRDRADAGANAVSATMATP
jgi:hypothetical protein